MIHRYQMEISNFNSNSQLFYILILDFSQKMVDIQTSIKTLSHQHSKYRLDSHADEIVISFQELNSPKSHNKFTFLNAFIKQSSTSQNLLILDSHLCLSKYFKVLCLYELRSFCECSSMHQLPA